jgi:hypothetical protein
MSSTFQDRDLWKYFDQSLLTRKGISEEELIEKLLQGFQAWMKDAIPSFLEDESAESVNQINKVLKEFAVAQFSTLTESASDELQATLNHVFQQWADSLKSQQKNTQQANSSTNRSASSAKIGLIGNLTQFFQDDDWSFTCLKGETFLRLAFAGNNGQWNCIAQARGQQQQAVFYSISPIAVPPQQLAEIVEFITRANYGMVLGNFELDYSDGEIRYKTSIDVEGDRLTSALIRNLVYTNVMTMDRYLPGILAVLEQGMMPEQAIRMVEDGDEPASANPSPDDPTDRLVW